MSGVSDGTLLHVPQGNGRKIVEALMAELKFDKVEQLETVPYYELAQAYNKVSPDITKDGGYVGNGPMAMITT